MPSPDAPEAPEPLSPLARAALLPKEPVADGGTWSPDPGLAHFEYQWLKNGTTITGATGETYTPLAGDVGAFYSVRVSASRDGFTPMSALSAS